MNKNKDNQTLTRVELEIMNHLWQINKPASVRELLESYDAPKPAYTTIGTYMKILTQKGFVKPEKHEDDGKTFFFRPLVSHEDYRRRVMSEVKDSFFGGPVSSLVRFFVKEEEIDDAELKELMSLIQNQ